MVITFNMEFLLKQAPNGEWCLMNPQQIAQYSALKREQIEKTDQLRALMINDRDIDMV